MKKHKTWNELYEENKKLKEERVVLSDDATNCRESFNKKLIEIKQLKQEKKELVEALDGMFDSKISEEQYDYTRNLIKKHKG